MGYNAVYIVKSWELSNWYVDITVCMLTHHQDCSFWTHNISEISGSSLKIECLLRPTIQNNLIKNSFYKIGHGRAVFNPNIQEEDIGQALWTEKEYFLLNKLHVTQGSTVKLFSPRSFLLMHSFIKQTIELLKGQVTNL